jgi:hypothetical protein
MTHAPHRLLRALAAAALLGALVLVGCQTEDPTNDRAAPEPEAAEGTVARDGMSSAASASDAGASSGALVVTDAWVRPGAAGGNTAFYARLTNRTNAADTLVAAALADAALADTVEIHETYERGEGMMGMRPMDALPMPAAAPVQLAPGGLHVMLIGLAEDVAEGDSVQVTLRFAQRPAQTVTAPVRTSAPTGPAS